MNWVNERKAFFIFAQNKKCVTVAWNRRIGSKERKNGNYAHTKKEKKKLGNKERDGNKLNGNRANKK